MLATLLLSALALALAILPLQLLAAIGYGIQRLWHRGEPGLVDPLLLVVVFSATLTLLAFAWGPLAAARGSGALTVELMQPDALPQSPRLPQPERLISEPPQSPQVRQPEPSPPDLHWRVQLLGRLPLLALSHLAGLAVGIETPAASFGATALLSLRGRLPLLAAMPQPLLAAIGAGAGLGTAFRSPLLGVVYGLECLGARSGLPLVLPTLLLAGLASLLGLDAAAPARLLTPLVGLLPSGLQSLSLPQLGLPPWAAAPPAISALGLTPSPGSAAGSALAALPPLLLPWALLLTLLAALVGTGLRGALLWLTPRLDRLLQRRFLPTALLLAALLTALAHLSGGISLNDGALDLGPALAGHPEAPRWAALPRLLSPLLAITTGAPGGLPHDCMSLGALLVAPLVGRLAVDQQAILMALGAAVVFSATCRTPLLAALFVWVLQGPGANLPLLLMASACGAALSWAIGDGTASKGPGDLPGALPGLMQALPLSAAPPPAFSGAAPPDCASPQTANLQTAAPETAASPSGGEPSGGAPSSS
ncbi:MAG: chloride channel protein [Cyanobium sp.]